MRNIIASFLFAVSLQAQSLIPPQNLFRDPTFVKEFVGSYGIHSEVEPKVSATESTLLARVSEQFGKGQYKEAEQEVVRFIKETTAPTDPNLQPGEISPALVFVLGNLYFQGNRFDEAERAFKEAIRRFPKFRRAHTNLAYLYISKEKFDDAMPMLQKAIELGENSHRAWGLLGFANLLKKNALTAENCYRTATVLEPTNKDWQTGLSQAFMLQEKYTEAAAALETLIKANPLDKQLILQQTNAYLSQEKKLDAILNLETMDMKGLADEANLNLLGNIYMDQSQPQLALSAYQRAMGKATKLDVSQALKSARIMNDFGNPQEAAELTRKIRSTVGANLLPADSLQLALIEVKISRAMKQDVNAGQILSKLIKEQPGNPEVMFELGLHYDLLARNEADEEKRKKLTSEAKTNYMLAIGNELTAQKANLSYGQMLVRDGRSLDALPFIEKALALKKSESLEQYVSRVRRAADREKIRKEREAAAREAAAKAAEAEKAAKAAKDAQNAK